MIERKLLWQAFATWTTYAGDRTTTPNATPLEVYFPVDALGNPITDPILAIREAVLKCSEAGGGRVFVGCDYPNDGDAFLLDYLGNYPGLTGTLVINDCHNVVIDFGGATIRQINFAQRVEWPAPDLEGPPGGDAILVKDIHNVYWYVGVGHPILRIENCTNLRIENLNIDGNRTATTASSWGTHAPYEAPFPHNSQAPDHGVQVVGGRDIVFSNVHVKNARMDGFFTHYATSGEALVPERVTFLDCSAIGCGRIGFAGDWGHELRLVRCVATDNGRDVVVGGNTYPAVVAGPADGAHFEAWWGTAVEVPGHRQIVVEQCTFRENGGRGVALTGHMMADGLIVRDCLFEENGRRTSYYQAKSGGGFHWAEVSSAHVLVSGAGATISGCSFLPISTVALGRDENEQPVNVEQVAMVWLTVNAHREDPNSQRPLEAWRRAGHRVIGNRFVAAHGGAADLMHAWRPGVEVVAQVNALHQPISEDGGSVVAENHFSRCWNAVTFRAPRGVFRGNTVIEGLDIAGASAHQAAVRAYNYASQCRVDQNLFVDVASRVVHLGDTPATEGGEDVSDFWFTDNIVRYDNATFLHDAAVELGASSNARSRLIGNLFIRDDFTPKKAAIRWNTTSNPTNMPQGIVMHGNVAQGAGWTSTTNGAAVWSMVQPAWLSRVLEASGNQPPLPGEAVTQPGRGLRLTAPDTSFASTPGTLWYDASNDTPMFRTQGGDQSLLAGTMSGPTSATDNAIARFNGTTGQVVQNSTVSVDDSGNLALSAVYGEIRIAGIGGGYRRLRGASDGLYVEDTASSNAVNLAAATVRLNATSAVQVRDGSTTWASFTTSTQRFGVGTSAPAYRVHAESDAAQPDAVVYVNQADTGASGGGIRVRIATAIPGGGNRFVRFNNGANSVIGRIAGDGTGGVVYVTTSDRALKRDIRPAEGQLARVLALRVSEYATHAAPDRRQIGLIAQEAALVCPEAASDPAELNARQLARVRGAEGAEERRVVDEAGLAALRADPALEVVEARPLTETDPEYERWGLDYGRLTPTLAGAIQELHALVRAQADQIAALEARLGTLEPR